MLQGKWSIPPRPMEIPNSIPDNLDNNQFVEWLYNAVLHQPESAFGYEATKLVRDLNIGAIVDHGVVEPIDRNQIFQQHKMRAENKAVTDKIRTGQLALAPEKFIGVANGQKN